MNEQDALKIVLGDAQEHPMAFIEILTKRILASPQGRTILADSLRDLAQVYTAEADALRAEVGRRNNLTTL